CSLRRRPRSTLFPYTTLFRSATRPELQAYVEASQAGLAKLPKHNGVTMRGASFSSSELENILSIYHEGAIVEDAAFVSSSYGGRSEEHTSELQSRENLVCRLL